MSSCSNYEGYMEAVRRNNYELTVHLHSPYNEKKLATAGNWV